MIHITRNSLMLSVRISADRKQATAGRKRKKRKILQLLRKSVQAAHGYSRHTASQIVSESAL